MAHRIGVIVRDLLAGEGKAIEKFEKLHELHTRNEVIKHKIWRLCYVESMLILTTHSMFVGSNVSC